MELGNEKREISLVQIQPKNTLLQDEAELELANIRCRATKLSSSCGSYKRRVEFMQLSLDWIWLKYRQGGAPEATKDFDANTPQ